MIDKTRREFLKSCFKIGGYAGIACLGMGAIEDARGWGILPGIISTAVDPPWADWDATTEAGIATYNRFAIFGEGGNSENETGQGGKLTGADLVWTQTGAIGGTGTYRTLTGGASDQYFIATTTFRDFMAGATRYGFMWNVTNWNPSANYETIIHWGDSHDIQLRRFELGPLYGNIQNHEGQTVNTPGTAVRLYIYAGCNGSDTRFGFTSSGSGAGGQPAKWSDFATNDRVSLGAAYALTTWNEATPYIFTGSGAGEEALRDCVLNFYWSVFCNNNSLIDFAA